jgi:trehalose 6-phosphate synthase/phosphatase
MSKRLIIVANRLPVQVKETDSGSVLVPSAGGLVSSIQSFLQSKAGPGNSEYKSTLWFGTLDISKKKYDKKQLGRHLQDSDFSLHPVFLPTVTRDKHYNGFCNDTIWPLFHYFPSYARYKDEYFHHYVLANQHFCEAIVAAYEPGDVIWIHDYHLMLLPELLRARIPEAQIGFFLHIPFPSFELFRMLPAAWRTGILNGLLGADLIGFHTSSYAQYFLRSVNRLLGHETSHEHVITPERTVRVDIFPVSIDFAKFNGVLSHTGVFEERNRLRKRLGEASLVISVDRLDYTKGILNRLEGFELFLKENPVYHNKVTLLMVVVPSRDIIAKYKELKEQMEGLISKINGRLGSLEWTPVIYQYRALDFTQLCGLYAAADVALVTPIRDGMNLVAKEFVASRSDKRGVLILSEGAGAANELGEAVIVNPTDRNEIANALHIALNMPVNEQMTRNAFMQRRLKHYDVVKWADDFIHSLNDAHTAHVNMKVRIMTAETEKDLQLHYGKAQSRLLLFDYDGTLVPIAKYPHLAVPEKNTLELLQALARDERNTVVVISGRNKESLQEWFGSFSIDLVAEHGTCFRSAGNDWEKLTTLSTVWKKKVLEVMNVYADRCPGSFVEEKEWSVAWHFRNADQELGFIRSRELHHRLSELATHLDFQVTEGKKLIEARPRGIDKGQAALKWIAAQPWNYILAIGDDRTDEDLFRALPPEANSIRVGLVHTSARFNFKVQKDVIRFLSGLAAQNLEHTANTATSLA